MGQFAEPATIVTSHIIIMKGTEVLNPRRGVPQWGYDANTRLLKHNMCGPGLYVMWTGRWFVMSDNK